MARGRGTIVTAVALSLPLAIGAWFALRFGLPSIAADPMLFALQCAGAAILLALVTLVEAVAHERLYHASIDPLADADSPRLEVNRRCLQNTLEQTIVFVPGLFLLAHYAGDLRAVAATAIVWTLGRWAFWIGYQLGPMWRGLGVFSMFQSLLVLMYGVGRFGFDLGGWPGAALLLGPFLAIEAYLFVVLRKPG
jgi:hypothetical protein